MYGAESNYEGGERIMPETKMLHDPPRRVWRCPLCQKEVEFELGETDVLTAVIVVADHICEHVKEVAK